MKIYCFLFNSCTFESSYATMSIHKTKIGAYKAMKTHKVNEFMYWYDKRSLSGKAFCNFAYDFGMAWAIEETILID